MTNKENKKKNCSHKSYEILKEENKFKCQKCGRKFTVDEVDRMIFGR